MLLSLWWLVVAVFGPTVLIFFSFHALRLAAPPKLAPHLPLLCRKMLTWRLLDGVQTSKRSLADDDHFL